MFHILRADSRIFFIAEVVVMEIEGLALSRKFDPETGLSVLSFDPETGDGDDT